VFCHILFSSCGAFPHDKFVSGTGFFRFGCILGVSMPLRSFLASWHDFSIPGLAEPGQEFDFVVETYVDCLPLQTVAGPLSQVFC
jgi:hypothetical protein